MRRIGLVAAVVLAASLTAAPMWAQSGPGAGMGQGRGMGPGMGQGMGMGNPDAPWRARFAAIDANGDGVVSRDEMLTNAGDVFAAMDSDGDGRLTKDEYMAVRMGAQRGLDPARMEERQAAKAARFPAMDTDRDGFVDKAEFLAGATGRFDAADRNGDGKLVPGEFRGRMF